MTCQVCRYHSGPLTRAQEACPRVHIYRDPPEPMVFEAWEVPSSAYSETTPDAEPVELCGHCGGSGLGHRLAREDEDDICTWCMGTGKAD